MDWISVEDKLPPDCENVLIYCPIIKNMTTAYLTYGDDGNPICFFIVDFDEYAQTASLKDVTHWMPLPKPPEE